MVTAIILIDAEQSQAPDVAQSLIALDGIAEVYSVAGQHDLVAVARVHHHDDLAELVTASVQKIPGIKGTNTLIAFRAYSRRNLEALWDFTGEQA